MPRTKARLVVAAGTLTVALLAVGAYLYTQWWGPHYTPGAARLDAYALTDQPLELKIFFATGWQDVVEQTVIVEDDRAVTITIPTRVFVPCRECFKQMSATLLETTVMLRSPLGQRVVRGGATNAEVKALPTMRQEATITLSPIQPLTCEKTQIEAQVPVATTAATITATCVTCSGRFPPPSPGTIPTTATTTLTAVAAGQGILRGEIVFPKGGTWRFDSAELPLPVTRPTVQVMSARTDC